MAIELIPHAGHGAVHPQRVFQRAHLVPQLHAIGVVRMPAEEESGADFAQQLVDAAHLV